MLEAVDRTLNVWLTGTLNIFSRRPLLPLLGCLLWFLGCSPDSDPAATHTLPPGPNDEPGVLTFEALDTAESGWTTEVMEPYRAEFKRLPDPRGGRYPILQVAVIEVSEGDPWAIQAFREDIALETGRLYHYVTWLKGPRGAQVNLGIEGPSYQPIANREMILVGDWQPVVFAFESGFDRVRTSLHFAFAENAGKAEDTEKEPVNIQVGLVAILRPERSALLLERYEES